jgi:hypothetical protein
MKRAAMQKDVMPEMILELANFERIAQRVLRLKADLVASAANLA